MPLPGPFAPTVTQWVKTGTTTDAKNNKVPVFTARSIRALAEFPGNALEADNAAGDLVTADRVLLVAPATAVSEYDEFTLTDGIRYRVSGAPGRYRSPFTGTAVTQVNLRRIT
jgi:hypothetical protein